MNTYINFVLLYVIRQNNRTEYFFPCLYKHLLCLVDLLSQNKLILSTSISSMIVL